MPATRRSISLWFALRTLAAANCFEAGAMSDHSTSNNYLVRLIRSAPRLNAPAGFTEKVMNRIPETRSRVLRAGKRFIGWLPVDGNSPAYSSQRECSFWCIVTGFFYLVLGVTLLAGLGNLCSESEFLFCLRFLPWVSFFVALWFSALGVMLVTGGRRAPIAAQWGLLSLLAVFSGGAVFYIHEAGVPAVSVFAAVSSMALVSGGFLYYRLDGYIRTVEPALRLSGASASSGRMERGH